MRTILALAILSLVACGHSTNGGTGADALPTDGTGSDAGQDAPPGDANCGLVTCASAGASCGLIGDGCNGTIDCGSCPTGETCGGGGVPFQCGMGGQTCTPRTCADAGATCGVVGDGCGGLTPNCGTCDAPTTCGGGSTPNACGCANLCAQIDACPAQPKSSIDGFIVAPGHPNVAPWQNWVPDPIYGALVYIPNSPGGALDPIPDGVDGANACPQCSDLVSGSPLVTATTDASGYLKLDNVPCGTDIPVVIQLGKWRREVTIPSVACCANTRLTDDQRHLPRNKSEGNIPRVAVMSGKVDVFECVLRKIGIDDAEFTNPSGTGRVAVYKNNGARINSSTPGASALYGSASELAKYDMTVLACEGAQNATFQSDTASQQRLVDYANAGGRVFATHFSYVWLTNTNNTGPTPFNQTATW